MLLAAILAISCKKADEKTELSYIDGWVSCPKGIGDVEWRNGLCTDDGLPVYVASIYALLSNPKFFDKKLVQTCGYLSGTPGDDCCSINWRLHPDRESALYHLSFTNALQIENIKEEGNEIFTPFGTEKFKHMEFPYGSYVCFVGEFSSNLHGYIRLGFTNADIYVYKRSNKIWPLIEKLDSLLKEGEDISEFQWSSPEYSPFEIQKGKIRSTDTLSDYQYYNFQYCNKYLREKGCGYEDTIRKQSGQSN